MSIAARILSALMALLVASRAGASIISAEEVDLSSRNERVDERLCDKVRYNVGLPKIDPLAAPFMKDCRRRLKQIPDQRPHFTWRESIDEATSICNTYIAGGIRDASSDFLEIRETRSFSECLKRELQP